MEFTRKKGILSAFWSLLSNPIVTDLFCMCLGAASWPRSYLRLKCSLLQRAASVASSSPSKIAPPRTWQVQFLT
ncbi:hypothetical protein B484DRAFT_100491 [Ochromonadaceae sp. CCMP2298]|nr:hypothetical protein B484DRAFT_100491 [Ochromonadaceae sp. CCMP2298]